MKFLGNRFAVHNSNLPLHIAIVQYAVVCGPLIREYKVGLMYPVHAFEFEHNLSINVSRYYQHGVLLFTQIEPRSYEFSYGKIWHQRQNSKEVEKFHML